jgi:hypothetical protein
MMRIFLLLFILPASFAGIWSCTDQPAVTGRYEAVNPVDTTSTVVLMLRHDGRGSWTVDQEEVPLRWDQNGHNLQLHYRSGGIIAGKIVDGNTIDFILPDLGAVTFNKKPE